MTPSDRETYYANYNQANRAPTVIELGCSNPAQPCGLPMISRAIRTSSRSSPAPSRSACAEIAPTAPEQDADLFRTLNADDIQFIATTTNSGYFANVGNTRGRA